MLSAGVTRGTLTVHGHERTYLVYNPGRRPTVAPLLILLHASKQTGDDLRETTGYAFDRLADQHGFVVAYPDGIRRRWNDCRSAGRNAARRRAIDDVEFLLALVDELSMRTSVDPARVFAAGYSNGGQLAFRLASERPDRVAAIAAFSANLPTPSNWGCQPATRAVPTMLVNGTADPISPFQGGEVNVFGFATRGHVRSAYESALFFANLAGAPGPERRVLARAANTWVESFRWYGPGLPEILLIAVHGGGHVVPGKHCAFPRILGPVSTAFDGPEEVWRFFARQLR